MKNLELASACSIEGHRPGLADRLASSSRNTRSARRRYQGLVKRCSALCSRPLSGWSGAWPKLLGSIAPTSSASHSLRHAFVTVALVADQEGGQQALYRAGGGLCHGLVRHLELKLAQAPRSS
jgi:hypothetical protein